jgi:hypothetical protein
MTVKYPQVPEDLSALSDADLEALRAGLAKAIGFVTAGEVELATDADKSALEEATKGLLAAKAEAKGRTEKAEADAKRLADAAAALQEDEPEGDDDEEDVDEDEDAEEAEAGGDPDGDDGDGSDEDADGEPSDASTSPAPVATFTTTATPAKPKKGVGAKQTPTGGLDASRIVALDGVPGKQGGDSFADWSELASALLERRRTVSDGSVAPVGVIEAKYPKNRSLEGLDQMETLKKLTAATGSGFGYGAEFAAPAELTAAMCAPVTPYYGMDCMNTTRRPVFNSLPGFPAPRGGVSIPTSPTLSDVTGGYGFWDKDDDADVANQTKNACLTVECPTSEEFFFYAVYRCLTVQNMMQMTWPEVVEAYLNRLAARTARAAEIQLLDLMATNVNRITAPGLFTSAAVQLGTQLNSYRSGAQERERWDIAEDGLVAWAPRWLLYYLQNDVMRRRNTTGGVPRKPSQAEIESSIFGDNGIDVTWYLDTPTWGVAAPTQGTGNPVQLVTPPASVNILIAPRGKFALIDRGSLTIGLQGNNVVRDLATLKKNQFTMFFETFEGIVDTNSCPADMLKVPLCFQGIQHADQPVDCFGAAEAPS